MQCHVTVLLMVASKQMNADQAVNAMPCKNRGAQPAGHGHIRVIWGMQIAKFLVEMEPSPKINQMGRHCLVHS